MTTSFAILPYDELPRRYRKCISIALDKQLMETLTGLYSDNDIRRVTFVLPAGVVPTLARGYNWYAAKYFHGRSFDTFPEHEIATELKFICNLAWNKAYWAQQRLLLVCDTSVINDIENEERSIMDPERLPHVEIIPRSRTVRREAKKLWQRVLMEPLLPSSLHSLDDFLRYRLTSHQKEDILEAAQHVRTFACNHCPDGSCDFSD